MANRKGTRHASCGLWALVAGLVLWPLCALLWTTGSEIAGAGATGSGGLLGATPCPRCGTRSGRRLSARPWPSSSAMAWPTPVFISMRAGQRGRIWRPCSPSSSRRLSERFLGCRHMPNQAPSTGCLAVWLVLVRNLRALGRHRLTRSTYGAHRLLEWTDGASSHLAADAARCSDSRRRALVRFLRGHLALHQTQPARGSRTRVRLQSRRFRHPV